MTSTGPLSDIRPCVQGPFGQPTAVMYVDLDHFMRICIDASADTVFALIRDFQRIVTDAVLGFKGELNAYQGDGVLATFSELPGRADCASRTLQCAMKILQQISALNLDRVPGDHGVISACIGLQYGQVWTGTISTSERFGPTLVGDAVNVAVRLEQRAHSLGTKIVVGDDFIQIARCEHASGIPELAQFMSAGPLLLRGRQEPICVWTLRNEAAESLRRSVSTHCPAASPVHATARNTDLVFSIMIDRQKPAGTTSVPARAEAIKRLQDVLQKAVAK
jgi:class 3 adenylate cyclase